MICIYASNATIQKHYNLDAFICDSLMIRNLIPRKLASEVSFLLFTSDHLTFSCTDIYATFCRLKVIVSHQENQLNDRYLKSHNSSPISVNREFPS